MSKTTTTDHPVPAGAIRRFVKRHPKLTALTAVATLGIGVAANSTEHSSAPHVWVDPGPKPISDKEAIRDVQQQIEQGHVVASTEFANGRITTLETRGWHQSSVLQYWGRESEKRPVLLETGLANALTRHVDLAYEVTGDKLSVDDVKQTGLKTVVTLSDGTLVISGNPTVLALKSSGGSLEYLSRAAETIESNVEVAAKKFVSENHIGIDELPFEIPSARILVESCAQYSHFESGEIDACLEGILVRLPGYVQYVSHRLPQSSPYSAERSLPTFSLPAPLGH